MHPALVVSIVCFLAFSILCLYLVVWIRYRETSLTNQLIVTEAFPKEATVMEVSGVYHPNLRDAMFNYNPSLFLYRGKRYMVHRLCTYNMCRDILHHIPEFKSTNEYQGVLNSIVIQTPLQHIVYIDYPSVSHYPCPEAYEDPRSIMYQNHLVLVTNNPQHTRCRRTMTALFLNLDEVEDLECASILHPFRILELSYEKSRPVEKNWMPFVYRDDLCFVYSVEPHVILRCDTETGKCTEIASTSHEKVPESLRGGSPCWLLTDGSAYLTVAHQRRSIGGVKLIYTSVLYCFEPEPPFRIVAMSPPLFFDHDFDPHRWKQIIQFAAGLVVEEKEGILFISYGSGDCSSRMISLPLASALTLIVPLSLLP